MSEYLTVNERQLSRYVADLVATSTKVHLPPLAFIEFIAATLSDGLEAVVTDYMPQCVLTLRLQSLQKQLFKI